MKNKIEFNVNNQEPVSTFDSKDAKDQLIKHLKGSKAKKPIESLKKNKKMLSFTDDEIKKIKYIQNILDSKTFNATIYKLINLGFEKFN